MKQNKGLKTKYIVALLIAAVIIAGSFLVINLTSKDIFKNQGTMKSVNISAQNFAAVDSNTDLTQKKSRLIVINSFHATKLNNNRNLHIYLPPGYYDNKDKRFPVLYAQDGKSVYDISDWSKESLNMHLIADKLISEGKIKEFIIVGIDNIGEMRINEYSHWDGVDMGKNISAQGLMYEDFVINDVKPFIDKNFRTLTDRDNTALMGDSIGGFVTFNIGYRHPEIFSKLAMMSPYFGWGNGRLYSELSKGEYSDKKPLKMWIDAGSEEVDFLNMAANTALLLLDKGYKYPDELAAYEAPGGEHSEKSWQKRIEPILLYFYGNIGKPASVYLYMDEQVSLSSKNIVHINPVVIYDSGFKMTDLYGSFKVENPEIFKIDGFGSGVHPLKEGTTNITFTSSSGLITTNKITIVK